MFPRKALKFNFAARALLIFMKYELWNENRVFVASWEFMMKMDFFNVPFHTSTSVRTCSRKAKHLPEQNENKTCLKSGLTQLCGFRWQTLTRVCLEKWSFNLHFMFELLKACSPNFPHKKCVWKYLYDPSHSLVCNILFMFVYEKREIAGKCKQPAPAHVTTRVRGLTKNTSLCQQRH